MAPKPEGLKLSQDAFKNDTGGQQKRAGRPERIRLVIGGTAGIEAINQLTYSFKQQGHVGREQTKLGGIVYEMNAGEKADKALDSFKVAFESPGNIPVTLIHPLTGAIDAKNIPPMDTPPQFAQICFSLPTIYKASDVQGDNEQKWLELFKVANQRSLTLELAVAPADDVREAVEKLLGKAWDNDVATAKQDGKDAEEAAGKKGVRILIDGFASPPLGQSSTQLMRSAEMKSWNDFVSRLALDPRVYLKLSPLPQPSAVVPTAFSVHRRQADAFGAGVPGAAALGSAAQAAIDTAIQAVNAAEAASVTSTGDRRDELQQRLRFFLETALEAFGEERLVFSTYLTSGSSTVTAIQGRYKDEAAHLSEPEQWFEAVLATLQDIGVGQEAVDNIFSNNVSKLYLM